ncbi:MAG: hypothetical protein U0637_05970 [Phycisphaerales bacterium]
MRLPRFRVYRAFRELDALSNGECESLVNRAEINHHGLLVLTPLVVMYLVLALWPAAWVVAAAFTSVRTYIPLLPSTMGGLVVLLIVSTVPAAGFAYLITRDVCLYAGLRRELRRCHCPRCDQPLVGLPIHTVGDDNDPGKRSVRCPECGRTHKLLDLGITPRDLVPFEQRAVTSDMGAFRGRRS